MIFQGESFYIVGLKRKLYWIIIVSVNGNHRSILDGLYKFDTQVGIFPVLQKLEAD